MKQKFKWTYLLAGVSSAALLVYGCASQPAPADQAAAAHGRLPAASEGDEAIVMADQMYLTKFGVTEEYSPAGAQKLVEAIRSRLDPLKSEAQTLREGNEEKDLEKLQRGKGYAFLTKALIYAELANKPGGSLTEEQKGSYYTLAKRVLYAILFDEARAEDQGTVRDTGAAAAIAGLVDTIRHKLPTGKRYLMQNIAFTVPFVEGAAVNQAVGPELAALEATDLDRGNDTFHVASDLARLSHRQIADLDIRVDHPAWHTEAARAQLGEGWTRVEKWFEAGATKHVNAKPGRAPIQYKIDQARRVLFLDKIKASATSPKIATEDAYGLEWKLKWGEEVQTEPMANRIFTRLGAKYVDLVYANGRGIAETVLVLDDPKKADASKPCKAIVTVKEFSDCLLGSKYKFSVDAYIAEAGTLDARNIDQVLAKLPPNPNKKYEKQNLLGRQFVSFRESMVEANPPSSILVPGGPAAFSSLGALNDRVARGLMVANFWIGSVDAKDENNRSNLVKGLLGAGTDYIEIQHDVGASFGDFPTWGQLNGFETGEDFLSTSAGVTPAGKAFGFFKQLASGSKNLYFKTPVLYYPKAWEHTTYADALWMAKKVAAVPVADIRAMAVQTKWPDFMQQVLVYKLVDRRNQIAKYFQLPVVANPVPSYELPLGSPKDIDAAAARFGLNAQAISEAIRTAAVPVPARQVDKLVVQGVLQPCESTVLMGVLERELYPTGLAVRLGRSFDNFAGDHGCKFGGPAKPTMLQSALGNLARGKPALF